MGPSRLTRLAVNGLATFVLCLLTLPGAVAAQDGAKPKGPPPVPVRVAEVVEKTVSEQVTLIGTTEAIAVSTIAAEGSGVVQRFPVKAGDFVKKGQLLVGLKDTEVRLRLKSYMAERDRVRANLENADRELKRLRKLRAANSISETEFDGADFAQRALSKAFLRSEAEIERLQYELAQVEVFAPFSGFVAQEHTQLGEWIQPGGPVVTLVDMAQILVTVDVPERFAVKISAENPVLVRIGSLSEDRLPGAIYAMLPQGNPTSRTIPVRVRVDNPNYDIRAGMEAEVTFNLSNKQQALLVPKDAVVTAGDNRMVYVADNGKALPVDVLLQGYYEGFVAVAGDLKPGMKVVVRGNERLRPGQDVAVTE